MVIGQGHCIIVLFTNKSIHHCTHYKKNVCEGLDRVYLGFTFYSRIISIISSAAVALKAFRAIAIFIMFNMTSYSQKKTAIKYTGRAISLHT